MDPMFTDDAIIQANINQQLAMAATHNVMAAQSDKLLMANYCRNAPIYKALGMDAPPAPQPPEIWTVDTAKVRDLLLAYNAAVGSGEGPVPELDFSVAISKAPYVRPSPAGPVVVGRPADPLLGVVIGPGKRGIMPGDDYPIGETKEKDGDTWVKVESDTSQMGDKVHAIYWQRQ